VLGDDAFQGILTVRRHEPSKGYPPGGPRSLTTRHAQELDDTVQYARALIANAHGQDEAKERVDDEVADRP
jgi:hypothetical protein